MKPLEEQIKTLELKLLHTDTGADPSLFNALLSEDFEEIGNTGHISSRQEVINWLINKSNDDRWLLKNFRIKILSTDWILAIYEAQKISNPDSTSTSRGSLRSSIWKRHGDDWQMVFHQGSKVSK
ncbi:hypothetical protein SAMN05216419_100162 [Nitrosomonas cryotolerans]|uniref:DUF4440 domain-containing protein n=1 Tax=Nitrosomonas cryotolerans ATCC 49181 TaxID=1131553 RepID=A0A1N6IR25_9PROT|nr:DUF4440 domain-containing protein [Nitrosomonas cryotolerans]SFP34191.1 hypothetical protein SAMN05216419_100162 [Nitrosomonas cryotolerans]SIO34443.1 hypothetical protein SAMN02743940_2003 [Nitrosomonas cryotolerans ATCC 49181]